MTKTSIEWCDEVWNPVTGCAKVSQGCKHCYAETIAERFWATQYPPNPDGSPRKFTDVRVHPERLEDPLRWKKPRRVFVNSMSDLFHESVTDEFIDRVFETMHLAYRHTFMILTKRPDRMSSWINYFYPHYRRAILPNVWLGVSVEDQKTADERIPLLLQTPAAIRFVSYEPALGPVDFKNIRIDDWYVKYHNSLTGVSTDTPWGYVKSGLPEPYGRGKLDWIIMGGESGPGARPMHPDWARSVRDQCQAAGVPFFFKQWGEWIGTSTFDKKPMGDYRSFEWNGGYSAWKVGKKAAGRILDGRTWDEFPEAQ